MTWRFQPVDDCCAECGFAVAKDAAQEIINAGDIHSPVWKRIHTRCKVAINQGKQETTDLPRCTHCHYLLINDQCTNTKCPVSQVDQIEAAKNPAPGQ